MELSLGRIHRQAFSSRADSGHLLTLHTVIVKLHCVMNQVSALRCTHSIDFRGLNKTTRQDTQESVQITIIAVKTLFEALCLHVERFTQWRALPVCS